MTIVQVDNPELLFHYSSGRWLWDESTQLSRRFQRFNIAELLKAGAAAVGSASCVRLEKLPEGNFNKALLLHMNDGKDIIAKIPNPNAGRPHFTTASEVATMDFARNVLGIPVPRVLAWCSNSAKNPVGAEYIFMEKVPGMPLSDFWDVMKGRDKATVVRHIVNFESRFASKRFPMYGSLYYSDDAARIPGAEVVQQEVPRSFTVGPTTGRAMFDDMRAEVNADHGPWFTAEEYFVAIAERESSCVKSFSGSSRQQGIYNAPGLYRPSSTAKLSVLSKVLAVIKPLLSTDKLDLTSVMWHSDLHNDNIFVDPDEPTRITGMIDWQAAHLSPLFLQARHPSLLEVDGPVPEGLGRIELPKDFEGMNSDQQLAAKKMRAAQSLIKLYELDLFEQVPSVYEVLRTREMLRNQILGLMGSIFDDGEPLLEGMLMTLSDQWDTIMATSDNTREQLPCPLSFSAEDRLRQAGEQSSWERSVEIMGEVIDDLGVYRGWDGWVSHKDYEPSLEKLTCVRESFLERHAATRDERKVWAASWPFGITQH